MATLEGEGIRLGGGRGHRIESKVDFGHAPSIGVSLR
jgi:hypothetical protein